MKARYRLLALIGLALGPAACGRGCTCIEGEKTYEKVKGKYPLSLVRKTKWVGGKIPGPVSEFYIHIETTPPIDEPLPNCTHADMTEDKDGKFVGYRCQDTHEKEWTVLRLRGGDRYLRECKAPVGTTDKPDWGKLESVRKSTDRIFECESSNSVGTMRELAHAVLEDEPAAAADYVTSLAAFGTPAPKDPWEAALAVVDDSTRAAAIAKLCPILADGKGAPAAYVRAARHCALESGGALAMLKTVLADAEHQDTKTSVSALVWSGLLAAKANAKEAGALLCQTATEHGAEFKPEREAIVAGLLGQTNTRCAVTSKWLSPPPCNAYMDCDGGLCSEPQLAEDWANWDGALDAGVRSDPEVPTRERAMLRAFYAAGPLPKELTVPNRRRRYEIPDSGRLPECSDGTLEAGAECHTNIDAVDVCATKANETTASHHNYTVHIDDTRQRLDYPRRACDPIGAACGNHVCCDDGFCVDGKCAPPTPRGASDAGAD